MAVTAQTGIFSFGAQSAKGAVPSTYYKHYASDIDLAPISDDRVGPPEIGGVVTPTLAYRAGTLSTGGALINPRLQNTIGWILRGATGAWTVSTDENVFGTTTTGFYHHEFYFDTTVQSLVPWMGFRKVVPGTVATQFSGETYLDSKIVGLTVALPNDGLISSRLDVLGRVWGFTDGTTATAWTYGNTQFDSNASVPIGSVTGGYLKIPSYSGTQLPVVQATFTLANAPLDIRQEKIYGSPYLEDVTIVGRSALVDMIVKWNDPDLFKSILTGTASGTQWTATPFLSNLDVYALSHEDSSVTGQPYELRFEAPYVMYQVVGGIRLAGNGAVMMRVTGTVIQPISGNYLTLHLGNTYSTGYAWP